MKCIYKFFLITATLFSLVCCRTGSHETDDISAKEPGYIHIRRELSHFFERGLYDSLKVVTRAFLESSLKSDDTLSVVYSGLSIAQGFLHENDTDSIKYYLELIAPYQKSIQDAKLQLMYHNISGLTSLKSELDYSKALEHFQRGVEWATDHPYPGSQNDQIPVLINIVSIYYIRSDKHGMEYAQKAYELSLGENISEFGKCSADKAMAMMYLLADEPDKAYHYISDGEKKALEGNFLSQLPMISVIYGDMYCKMSDYSKAEDYYIQALEHSENTTSGTNSLVYLNYGKCAEQQNRISKANELYLKGLQISYESGSLEFRRELLHRLSELHYMAGDKVAAVDYSRKYWAFTDSVKNIQRDHEFNNQVLSYQRIQHDHEIQTKELSLLKANRKIEIAFFVMLLIMVLSVSLWMLYKRQRRMYRSLVAQHQNNIRNRKESKESLPESPTETSDHNGQDKDFFRKVERLMREEEFFKQKDISLEKVAERLATNKTYISKAINTSMGISFNNYINMYRIGEATNLLSNSENEIPLKQLADNLGYNSLSVFYKAFQKATGSTPGNYRKKVMN